MFGRNAEFEDPSSWGEKQNPAREIGALEPSDLAVDRWGDERTLVTEGQKFEMEQHLAIGAGGPGAD